MRLEPRRVPRLHRHEREPPHRPLPERRAGRVPPRRAPRAGRALLPLRRPRRRRRRGARQHAPQVVPARQGVPRPLRPQGRRVGVPRQPRLRQPARRPRAPLPPHRRRRRERRREARPLRRGLLELAVRHDGLQLPRRQERPARPPLHQPGRSQVQRGGRGPRDQRRAVRLRVGVLRFRQRRRPRPPRRQRLRARQLLREPGQRRLRRAAGPPARARPRVRHGARHLGLRQRREVLRLRLQHVLARGQPDDRRDARPQGPHAQGHALRGPGNALTSRTAARGRRPRSRGASRAPTGRGAASSSTSRTTATRTSSSPTGSRPTAIPPRPTTDRLTGNAR